MRNINLLIRKSFMDQYGMRVLVISLLLFILLMGLFWWMGKSIADQINSETIETNRIEQRVAQLQQQKQVDDRTVQYEQLDQQVSALREQRPNWKPLFDGVLGRLPAAGRINQIKIGKPSADGIVPVQLGVDLKDWQTLKRYMNMLQEHPLVANVKIQGLTKQTLQDPTVTKLEEEQSQMIQQIQIPVAPPLTNESRDPFLDSLNAYLAPNARASSTDEGSDNQGASETTDEDLTGPFSTEDFQKAEQALEQLTNRNLTVPEPTAAPIEMQETETEPAETSEVEYLQCTLEISFRQSVKQAG